MDYFINTKSIENWVACEINFYKWVTRGINFCKIVFVELNCSTGVENWVACAFYRNQFTEIIQSCTLLFLFFM